MLHRAWIFIPDLGRNERSRDTYYWDGNGPEPQDAPPIAAHLNLTRVRTPTTPNPFGFTEQQYMTLAGSVPSTAKRDTYNPFGRFNTNLTTTAFLPFSFVNVPDELGGEEREEIDFTVFSGGAPDSVTTASGTVLYSLGPIGPFGMLYGDGPATPPGKLLLAERINRPQPMPRKIKTALDSLGRSVHSRTIDKSVLRTWRGTRKKAQSQLSVMGVSAAEVAAAAGYDPDALDPAYRQDRSSKKHGWQWLHLIAYELGGPTETGPQSAANLVVGTTAANTWMIIVEDALADAIARDRVNHAEVTVLAILDDEDYRIAGTIAYHITFTLTNGRVLAPLQFDFAALALSTPYVQVNRYFRQLLRRHLERETADDTWDAPSPFLDFGASRSKTETKKKSVKKKVRKKPTDSGGAGTKKRRREDDDDNDRGKRFKPAPHMPYIT